MQPKNRNVPKSLVLTYISVFAALNATADLIPFGPIRGIPGASFSLGWILAPLTGILLGIEIGATSCFIAGIIEIFLGLPPIFGFFTPLRSPISAIVTGMLVSRNWRTPAITLLALISFWLLLPAGRGAYIVLIFHTAGLVMILLLRAKIGDLVSSCDTKKGAWGILLATYCGNISRHLFGNVLSATILNLQPIVFISAIPSTFVEQLTFAIGTSIVGISLDRLRLREFLQLRQSATG